MAWRKSAHSGDQGNCVEIVDGYAVVPVRDGKDPGLGYLTFSHVSWSSLTGALRLDV
ncbi:DUF397 domain-containing protein [Embleya sp. AB8]|uniref:DUF397 domain-containing protein n=1 Tax=Embleya sp. AB8 TaxID=3156304 RepID=UPI003C7272F4